MLTEEWSLIRRTFEKGFLMFLFTCGCFIKESSHSRKCIDTWLVVFLLRLGFRAEVRYFVYI